MKKIVFILGTWIYFVFEGLTEAMTWSAIRSDPNMTYHLFRLGENVGILIAFLIILKMLFQHIKSFWKTVVLSIISGLSLYEMVYSKYVYGNFLYNKTSIWIFIKHPPGWIWLVLFSISLVVIVFLFCKEEKAVQE